MLLNYTKIIYAFYSVMKCFIIYLPKNLSYYKQVECNKLNQPLFRDNC